MPFGGRAVPEIAIVRMSWLALLVAGVFEVCWAVGLKRSDGLSHPGWSAFTLVTLALSMLLLAYAVRTLPLGTAYGVWTGIGAVGTVLLGMVLFDEPRDLPRLFFLGLVVAGIIGLRVVSGGE